MDLGQAANAAEIIAAVGVVFSMIFVGWQVRQNTSALKRTEYNEMHARFQNQRLALVADKELAGILSRPNEGLATLTPSEIARLDAYLMDMMWTAYYMWDRFHKNLVERRDFGRIFEGRMADFFASRMFMEWWQGNKDAFSDGFVSFVGEMQDLGVGRIAAGQGAGRIVDNTNDMD